MGSKRTALSAFLLVVTATTLVPVHLEASSAIALRGETRQVVAWSHDIPGDSAMVLLNRRGLVKRAMVAEGVEPVSWVAGYGSVTVSAFGPDFPFAGVNQAGLVVVAVPLENAGYVPRGRNAEIGPLQWVQYALDSFENVRQVIYSAEQYRIHGPVGYHFLTCDARGACAVVEPVDGEIVSRAEDRLPLAILTTRSFEDAIDYLNVSLGYGGRAERSGEDPVLERFVRSVEMVNEARSSRTATPREDALRILRETEGDDGDLRLAFDPAERTAWIEAGAGPWPVAVLDFDLSCAPGGPSMLTVPPRPEATSSEAFQPWEPAVATRIAAGAAAATDGISKEDAAAMAAWATRYRCSDLPPVKHHEDPGSVPVE